MYEPTGVHIPAEPALPIAAGVPAAETSAVAERGGRTAVVAAVLGRFLRQDEVVLEVERDGRTSSLRLSVDPSRPWVELLGEARAQLEAGLETATRSEQADCWIAVDEGGRAGLRLELDRGAFPDERARSLLASFEQASRCVASAGSATAVPELGRIPLVSEAMREQLLRECRGAERPDPQRRTVRDLIEAQVRANPERVAVVCGNDELTYAELDGKAGALGRKLREAGVAKGDRIGVLVAGGLELPIAILAALKVSAVFIPLDGSWPRERLREVLRNADPKLLLGAAGDRALDLGTPVLELAAADLGGRGIAAERLGADDLAYGYPTSGSSGTPKCALNLHRGLANRLLYMTRHFDSGPAEVVLQNSRHVFDSALWQLLWPLTTGGRTIVRGGGSPTDFEHVIALIERHGVTMTDFVPSIFNVFVKHLERCPAEVARLRSLRNLLIGGEEVKASSCRRFRELLPEVGLTNTYGPTEAAIGMVFHAISPDDGARVPLGRPIDNTFALVLDEERRLLPPGAVGEIYVGGECLGVGYLEDPERTAQNWLPSPFSELPGERIYRTGDLGCYGVEGRLGFLGRIDDQVKVGGVRVEPGEIERALVSLPGVEEAAVDAEETVVGTRLVAHLAGEPGLDVESVREQLGDRLPRQLVPGRFVLLPALPLTHNGKIDRGRLAASPEREGGAAEADPAGFLAGELVALWRDLLGVGTVGLDDDFFSCGGDSLLALQLAVEVEERLGRRIEADAIYENPTLRQLATVLAAEGGAAGPDPAGQALAIADLALADEIRGAGAPRRTAPERVLLTGATGFVGAHLLARLLSSSPVDVAVLVREGDVSSARARLREVLERLRLWDAQHGNRLWLVPGDLEAERFGVAPELWSELARSTDAIVHCGGVVDFLRGYDGHRGTNVLGTARVLRLAAEGEGVVVHHVSSAGIGPRANAAAGAQEDCRRGHGEGYEMSKWVADHLVSRACLGGVGAMLYRLGEVMPHSRTGVLNRSALSHALLASCLEIGAFPQRLITIDYAPADCVAAAICEQVLAPARSSKVVDLWRPHGVSLDTLMAELGALGATVEPVDGAEFVARLQDRCRSTGGRALTTMTCVLQAATKRRPPSEQAGERALRELFDSPEGWVSKPAPEGGAPATWPEVDRRLLRPILARLGEDR